MHTVGKHDLAVRAGARVEIVTIVWMIAEAALAVLNRFLHVWWIEYAASLALLVWIGHEAKETFEAARDECADH